MFWGVAPKAERISSTWSAEKMENEGFGSIR